MYDIYQETWQELTAPGAPFEVEKITVRNSLVRAYTNAPLSLREFWLSSLAFAERDYLVYGEERMTYAEVHVQVASIANWLADQGVKSGDRVAISMRNYPEWLMIYWACVSTGIAAVGMNAWWVEDEMEYGLEDCSPKVLFCDEERLNRFLNIKDKFANLATVGVRLKESRAGIIDFSEVVNTESEMPDILIDPDQDACIFYTSGTTGNPKGAQLTHRGCIHNIMNMSFGGQLMLLTSCKINNVIPPDPQAAQPMNALATTPLFHVAANNCLAHPVTRVGGKLVLMYRWDAGAALKLIEAEGITIVSGVPVMSRELVNHPDFENYDTSTLRSVSGGGAQVQPDLMERIDQTVRTARPSTGFGMTETCGGVTSIIGDFFVDKPESCGPAMPAFEVKIVDADGKPLPQGEAGELWLRGAAVIKGYLNQEAATAETITDGWLHTGDVAKIDEHGFIFIVDRVKDMVLRGGENVYCSEVEAVLHRLDEIAECSVFSVPDERLGEEVGVSIYLKPGVGMSADRVREFCLAHMAKHKSPRYIWFSPKPLPRNASGKFLKRELRDSLNVTDAV
jgi:long-chain acyl-CoA synthetase